MNKYKVYVLIAFAFIAVIILINFFITDSARSTLNKNLIEYYLSEESLIARNISKALESEIKAVENELLLMSEDLVIKNGKLEECNAEVTRLQKKTGSLLGNVGRVDKDGFFRCSLNPALVGTKASNLGRYIDDIFGDPEHKTVMSRAIPVPGGKGGYLVAIHVPVWNGSEFDGTLGGALYLSDLDVKYLKDVIFAERGFVALFDDDGTVLYHKKENLIGKSISSSEYAGNVGSSTPFEEIISDTKNGSSGTKRYINIEEGEKISAYVPFSPVSGRVWTVLVTVPVTDAKIDLVGIGADRLLVSIWFLIASVVFFLGLIFIIFSKKYIFNPIKQIQDMKSDFVSLVSHQLKTPVAQIKGFVDNMLTGLTGELNDKQKTYLHNINNVADKNAQLIDDLLNVSQIERGILKVNIAPLEVRALLEDVLAPLRDKAKAKGVVLEENISLDSVIISGDPVKTREALRNIVDNALKFTNPERKVTVSAREDKEYAVIDISDEGGGIDPDVQGELFKKDRVWSGKVKASGAGLGLYLSKQFIELTHGMIEFETEVGKGTKFIIKFPKINGTNSKPK